MVALLRRNGGRGEIRCARRSSRAAAKNGCAAFDGRLGCISADENHGFWEEVNTMNGGTRSERAEGRKPQRYRVRLPGFVSDKDIGLGDTIKRATSTVGIRPCGGCERRASALNRWMVFSGRRHSR
jgi:hypothetical protein